jgi:hypothetical protein
VLASLAAGKTYENDYFGLHVGKPLLPLIYSLMFMLYVTDGRKSRD